MASEINSKALSGEALKLVVCDLAKCEAMCCHDGVYLMAGEEEFLIELVNRIPALKALLPETFIVDGYWNSTFFGRKTATRKHEYRNPDYPVHFPKTRCVFADEEGFCKLEKFARSRGQHPWTFKPAACWLFPLGIEAGEAVPPPADSALDPYRQDNYPGYVTVVPCGRHNPNGQPWRETLRKELTYLEEAHSVPILGSPGHTVKELLDESQDTGENRK